jgi:hypothetical protein
VLVAGDLLTGDQLDRVKRYANPECGWLFLDDSRAGSSAGARYRPAASRVGRRGIIQNKDCYQVARTISLTGKAFIGLVALFLSW